MIHSWLGRTDVHPMGLPLVEVVTGVGLYGSFPFASHYTHTDPREWEQVRQVPLAYGG